MGLCRRSQTTSVFVCLDVKRYRNNSAIIMYQAAIVGLLVLAVSVTADPVNFRDCGSTKGKIASLDVTNCPSLPCPLKRSTNVTFTMQWTPSEDISAATNTVVAFLNGKIKTPFPLSDNDACHDMTCPAKSGTSVTYKHTMYIQPLYPEINVLVNWEVLVGQEIATCFSIPVKIVA